MTKVAIVSDKYLPVIDVIKSTLENVEVIYCQEIPKNKEEYDLVAGIRLDTKEDIINTHFSLLPSFDNENPVEEAFLTGVKVTGLSIYYPKTNKILAQYPVFITNDKYVDDIEQELVYIEQILYPKVIEKILNNEQFEVKDLMKKNCSGNCSSCGGCNS